MPDSHAPSVRPIQRPDVTVPARVLVTGAAGFIGRAVAAHLLEAGVEVIGVDRHVEPMPQGIVAVVGDTTAPGAWAAHLDGVDVVIHTAAVVSNVAPLAQAWEVNVAGTARTLAAAQKAGVRRFVHLSSIAAYGFEFPDGVDEWFPTRVNGYSYVDTKVNGEAVVLAAHAAGEIDTVIVRPGDVYGPGSRPWVLLPLEIISAGQAILPRGGQGVFSPAYIDNVVDGVVLAVAHPDAPGRIYNLTDGVPVTCGAYFGELATWVDGKVRTMPARPAFALASTVGALQRAVGRDSELCGASMHMLNRRGTYSIERARQELGYEPAVDLAVGLERTRQWWLSQAGLGT